MTESRGERKRRANGEESRRRILDAAAEIAGERGYEGTSIALVSEKCGLPASSIYWHFKNKDDLIAAVIERSFDIWVDVLALPGDDSEPMPERLAAMAVRVAKTLLDSPDFLRLGLMLTLERRPEEPSARRVFLQVRETARARLAAVLARVAPDADRDTIETITTYAIAATDGLFIAKEIGGDSVDLLRLFELLGRSLYDSLTRLTGGSPATETP
ncbi:TetR/AcrR family transcriptional regulator [Micromonospora globispora]|uniref:TetR/AcrR family transcriptional regulator n=1 Tax=Micromonospora globispora TaxID=1450148 RepID=A0A317K2N5_9ACTN|nr:TetR/AcrR family transcriptional regulator [Micromonospora globispora]PWU47196.1 TetR/AcrR family transcriptional regulator [Micromonospora globispora]PWU60351.1 TetR/AcrR family transcriptional regulator [Micromonospora globispora]RQW92731.1 TetR/AcrR family transcriptional regulator [Micromonospora globispora]